MAPKADWEKYKGPDKDSGKEEEPIVALDEVSIPAQFGSSLFMFTERVILLGRHSAAQDIRPRALRAGAQID